MKKVIFVCLLTLSVCFSQPTTQEAALQTPAAVSKQNATATDAKAAEKPEHLQTTAVETPATPPAVTAAAQNATAANVAQAVPVSNETSTKTKETKETKPAEKNNSTETKPSADPVKPVDPPKANNETKPAANTPANNGTNADSKDGKKNEPTTPKGENVSPTVAPVEAKSRAFDGPSFIGGIILTLGLLAIGFMGFKYYKNQTERNYHTL